MPRPPKRPGREPFRLQVILDGPLVAAIDKSAAKLSKPVSHTFTRSDVVRAALRDFVFKVLHKGLA